ncbi:unnamed protein product [Rhizoctonia solani]|uniref:PNPLA domain-containing protein n=1 Tax=Rhizoctonia solani TaxID=456999 RepID=A0A8H3DHF3_9AGAM|nr:unnamed protein product [Rhizoctonia solani]
MSDLDPRGGLNILCIDGGGLRGLSALVLLEELMKRIQLLKKLDLPPDPHQCFDVIAGTGTGAIQACMLGRLRMSVHSAIESYANLAKDVFSEKKRIGSGSFKTTKLKDSLRGIIQNATGDPEVLMIEPQQAEGQCKTLVFAMSRLNMRAGIPTTFRSYHVAANAGPSCTIWETLCATMAHPDLFKSFSIGGPLLNQSFVDAGLGCNNPLVHVLAEVKRLHPERYVASVTSIGTGHTRTIQIPNRTILDRLLPIAAIVAMKNIETDTERVAEEMARRFNSTKNVYFRLNVDKGMQSVGMDGWEQLSEVLEHTYAYMRLVDIDQRVDKVARVVHSRRPTVPTTQIGTVYLSPAVHPVPIRPFVDGEIQVTPISISVPSTVRRCPAPTPIFTGCELKICRIESCIAGGVTGRKVCIVHGLGGAGKTQIVLKAVERTHDKWKDVVFIDASTRESIESMLKDVAIARKVDDPSLPIRDYIPRGNHGSIIITTRLSGMVLLAQGTHSDCNISSMDPDDALVLLLKSSRKQDQELPPEEIGDARMLLRELGHLALAIVHAGSFIGHTPHMSITEYRKLFTGQQRRALEAYSKFPPAVKVDNYGHTVHTAWLMCYELLGSQARELLWLIAYLHHTGISIDIFRRAAQNISSRGPVFPTSHIEKSARQKLRNFLHSFLDVHQHWDGLPFTETIDEILSHLLLEYDRMNQAYRIHVLVQGWVLTIIPYPADLAAECTRTLLSVSTPSDDSLESIMFRMSIGLHVDKVFLENPDATGLNHAEALLWVLADRGQWAKIIPLYEKFQGVAEKVLGNDNTGTVAIKYHLARAYSKLDRFEEARALQVWVLDAWKRVGGKDDPITLMSMSNLATTYSKMGQLEMARALHEQVLATRKRVLGKDHPNTLVSANGLAITYSRLGQREEAKILLVQVVDAYKQVSGKDHPYTLRCMANLALCHEQLGQLEEARALYEQVLDARKRVLGNDHPDTLENLNRLGSIYLELGLWEEVERLQIEVQKFARVFGEAHDKTNAARELVGKIRGRREKDKDSSS